MLRASCGLAAALLFLSVPCAAADQPRNAWGIYVAPTTSGFGAGTEYDLGTSSTALEWGAFYTRFIDGRFSARLEARYAPRHLEAAVPYESGGFTPYAPVRLKEEILELPFLVQSERRVAYGERELRLSLGMGVVWDIVLDQKLVTPLGQPDELTASDYQKLGWLLDGAVTFEVDDNAAVFGRFRYQRDETTFGESDGASAVAKLECFGFSAGFEFGF
jgi:hypothetical protein